MGKFQLLVLILIILYIKYIPGTLKETREKTGNINLYRIQVFLTILTIIFMILSLNNSREYCMNIAFLLILCLKAVEKIMTKTGNVVLYALGIVLLIGIMIFNIVVYSS